MLTLRAVLALLVLPCLLPGQTVEEMRQRLAEGRRVWDMSWKLDDEGVLFMSGEPAPGEDRDWMPVFSELARDGLANLGLLGWLNILLAGPRDLASLADSELYYTGLGLDTSDAGLRKKIVTPVIEEEPLWQRHRTLERILAVRLVQERGIDAARVELETVSEDADADRFLRRATRDALAAWDGTPPTEAGELPEDALRELPATFDVLFYFDQRRIPPVFFLPRLAVQVGISVTLQAMPPGTELPPASLGRLQKLTYMPSLLPFELARRYGNARIDWILGAYRAGENPPDLFFQVQGVFDEDRIAAAISEAYPGWEAGMPMRIRMPLDMDLSIGPRNARFATPGYVAASDAARGRELAAAGLGSKPVWIRIPRGSSLWDQLPLPVATTAATLEVDLPAGRIEAVLSTEHGTNDLAQDMADLLAGLREPAELALEAMERAPEIEKLLGLLRAVTVEAEGTTCTVRLAIHGLTPDEFFKVLQRLPLR